MKNRKGLGKGLKIDAFLVDCWSIIYGRENTISSHFYEIPGQMFSESAVIESEKGKGLRIT